MPWFLLESTLRYTCINLFEGYFGEGISFTFLCRALYETCFFSPRTKKQFQTEEQPTDVMQKLLVQSRNGESKILGEKIEMKKGLSV